LLEVPLTPCSVFFLSPVGHTAPRPRSEVCPPPPLFTTPFPFSAHLLFSAGAWRALAFFLRPRGDDSLSFSPAQVVPLRARGIQFSLFMFGTVKGSRSVPSRPPPCQLSGPSSFPARRSFHNFTMFFPLRKDEFLLPYLLLLLHAFHRHSSFFAFPQGPIPALCLSSHPSFPEFFTNPFFVCSR